MSNRKDIGRTKKFCQAIPAQLKDETLATAEYKGKVKIDKQGIPFVTLNEKTSDGRKRVRWHKGFSVIKCPSGSKKSVRK